MALVRSPKITADGTFSSAGADAWNNQIFGVSGATSGGIPYFDSATSEASSAMLAQYGVVLGGGAGAAPYTSTKMSEGSAAGAGLTIAAGTATTNVNALSVTQTWNNAGVTFTAITADITNSASITGNLMDLKAGGNSKFKVDVGGVVTAASALITSSYVRVGVSSAIEWGGSRNYITAPADGQLLLQNNAATAGLTLCMQEMTAPTGSANQARIFAQDNGAGKTQLMVIFGSGAAQQIAIEV